MKPLDYIVECETVSFNRPTYRDLPYIKSEVIRIILHFTQIRQRFRDKLREWIDAACYSLLREIERDMVREGIKTARYTNISEQIIYYVWAMIKLPIGLKQVTDKDRHVSIIADIFIYLRCHVCKRTSI